MVQYGHMKLKIDIEKKQAKKQDNKLSLRHIKASESQDQITL